MSDLSEPQVLMVVLEGLKQAASGSRVMGQMQSRPQWFAVSDLLEGVRTRVAALATMSPTPHAEVIKQLHARNKVVASRAK